MRVVFDNTFWLGSGIFLSLKVFHILNKFSTFSPADVVAVKTVFHVKHCFFLQTNVRL